MAEHSKTEGIQADASPLSVQADPGGLVEVHMMRNWLDSESVCVGDVMLLGVFGIVVVLGAGAAIAERVTFPQTLAKIEQLRHDAAKVDPAQAEDVIGQVVQTNQFLVSERTCNWLWYCDVFAVDDWDRVPLIPVPSR